MYNAHTWIAVSDKQMHQWQSAIRKPLYSLLKGKLGGLPPFLFDVNTLAGLGQMLPPIDALQVARHRFMKRVLEDCTLTMWTLLWDAGEQAVVGYRFA